MYVCVASVSRLANAVERRLSERIILPPSNKLNFTSKRSLSYIITTLNRPSRGIQMFLPALAECERAGLLSVALALRLAQFPSGC